MLLALGSGAVQAEYPPSRVAVKMHPGWMHHCRRGLRCPVQQQAAPGISNQGQFQIAVASDPAYGLTFQRRRCGGLVGLRRRRPRGDAGYLTVNNDGAVTLTGPGTQTAWSYALLMQSIGGAGGNYTTAKHDYAGGRGGSAAGGIWVANTMPISLSGTFPLGASALEGQGIGGNGGYSQSGTGGTGGDGGVVQVQNNAAVTIGTVAAPVAGAVGARGVAALSTGGLPGDGGQDGGAAGGAGGEANVFNYAPVGLVWDWGSAGSASDALYGVLARSSGQDGAQTETSNTNGGAGGGSGSVKVDLNQSNGVFGNVSVTALNAGDIGEAGLTSVFGAAVAAISQGGTGGPPYGADADLGPNPLAIGGPGGAPDGGGDGHQRRGRRHGRPAWLGPGHERRRGRGQGYPEYGYADGRDSAGGDGGSQTDFSKSVSVSVNSGSVSTSGGLAAGILAQGIGGAGATATASTPTSRASAAATAATGARAARPRRCSSI